MLISVDGGATKTVAVCYSEDGKIHGMGVSGPGNYRTSGIEMAEKKRVHIIPCISEIRT